MTMTQLTLMKTNMGTMLRRLSPYKSNQSWLPRTALSVTLGTLCALVVSRIASFAADSDSVYYMSLQATAILLALFVVLGTHNIPTVADFIIDTHSEMQRVTWPSLRYVKNSLAVIFVSVAILVVVIFVIDVFWNIVFDLTGILVVR